MRRRWKATHESGAGYVFASAKYCSARSNGEGIGGRAGAHAAAASSAAAVGASSGAARSAARAGFSRASWRSCLALSGCPPARASRAASAFFTFRASCPDAGPERDV